MLDEKYWESRYCSGETGWDMGMVSPPLKEYIDGIRNKNIHILIPGCGNAYEAAYLLESGFSDITLIDIAETPVSHLQKKFSGDNRIKIIRGDFFEHAGQYDLILEQTFFCAIDPSLRKAYAVKMNELLAPGGILAGVWFDRQFENPGPPFGGSSQEYREIFGHGFSILEMDACLHSHPMRQGSELFMVLRKS